MGTICAHEFTSLDGVIDTPTWTFDFGFDPAMGSDIGNLMASCTAILLGRNTYQMFEPAWSARTAKDDPGASENHVLLDTVSGPGDFLSASSYGGKHWKDLFSDGGSFNGWEGPAFVTARTSYLVGPTQYASPHLYRTNDAGAHWHTITIP
jgi:hypothetical protein